LLPELRRCGNPDLVSLRPAAELAGNGGGFQTRRESVYRSVERFVERGLASRQLGGVESLDMDKTPNEEGASRRLFQIDAAWRFHLS
jgi:hypothetical protein